MSILSKIFGVKKTDKAVKKAEQTPEALVYKAPTTEFESFRAFCDYVNDCGNFGARELSDKIKNTLIEDGMAGKLKEKLNIGRTADRTFVENKINEKNIDGFSFFNLILEQNLAKNEELRAEVATNTAMYLKEHLNEMIRLLAKEEAKGYTSYTTVRIDLAPAMKLLKYSQSVLPIDRYKEAKEGFVNGATFDVAVAEADEFIGARSKEEEKRLKWIVDPFNEYDRKSLDFTINYWNEVIKNFVENYNSIQTKTAQNENLDKDNASIKTSINFCKEKVEKSAGKSSILNPTKPWVKADYDYSTQQQLFIDTIKTLSSKQSVLENDKTTETYSVAKGVATFNPATLLDALAANNKAFTMIVGGYTEDEIVSSKNYNELREKLLFLTPSQKKLLVNEYAKLKSAKEIPSELKYLKEDSAKTFEKADFTAQHELYNYILDRRNDTGLSASAKYSYTTFYVDDCLTKHLVENTEAVRLAIEADTYTRAKNTLENVLTNNETTVETNKQTIKENVEECKEDIKDLKTLQGHIKAIDARINGTFKKNDYFHMADTFNKFYDEQLKPVVDFKLPEDFEGKTKTQIDKAPNVNTDTFKELRKTYKTNVTSKLETFKQLIEEIRGQLDKDIEEKKYKELSDKLNNEIENFSSGIDDDESLKSSINFYSEEIDYFVANFNFNISINATRTEESEG